MLVAGFFGCTSTIKIKLINSVSPVIAKTIGYEDSPEMIEPRSEPKTAPPAWNDWLMLKTRPKASVGTFSVKTVWAAGINAALAKPRRKRQKASDHGELVTMVNG